MIGNTALVVAAEGGGNGRKQILTPEEVAERYRGGISVGTLRNWRAMRLGPSFVKVGKGVLYPIDALDAWDETNMVPCRASRRLADTVNDRP